MAKATRTVHRSAVSGKFVKEAAVKRSPRTTVTEKIKVTKKSK